MILLLLFTLLAPPPETYRVTVTKTDRNLYKIDGTKTYIRTKLCVEVAAHEEAILRYDRLAYDNALIFDQRGSSCQVESLLTESR